MQSVFKQIIKVVADLILCKNGLVTNSASSKDADFHVLTKILKADSSSVLMRFREVSEEPMLLPESGPKFFPEPRKRIALQKRRQ